MRLTFFFFFLGILLLSLGKAQFTAISLPISQATLIKINLSIDFLKQVLQTFGTAFQNKQLISTRVELTKMYLQELQDQLGPTDNLIMGKQNEVDGCKNIVFGNYNKFEGNDNWVFLSKYRGKKKVEGNLIVGKWRIELDKTDQIKINPRFAISFLQERRNTIMRRTVGEQSRQMCRFGEWTNPENQKRDNFFKKFKGYNEWKEANAEKNLRQRRLRKNKNSGDF